MKLTKRKIVGLAAGALLLAGCSTTANESDNVAVKGLAHEKQETTVRGAEFISLDEAKEIAFNHAGVDGSTARFDDRELENDDQLYELEFYVDGVEYEYDIDAVSGEVLSSERDDYNGEKKESSRDKNTEQSNQKQTEQSNQNSQFISLDEAKEISFNHAGVDGTNARFDDQELDRDDRQYELEFYVDGVEYEYDIHAVNGSILESERDDDRDDDRRKVETKQTQQTEEQPKEEPTPQPQTEQQKPQEPIKEQGKTEENQPSNNITKEKALEIALNHAGLSRTDVSIDDLEKDDGKFEVEFETASHEYEYDIHAGNGSILDYEVEEDD